MMGRGDLPQHPIVHQPRSGGLHLSDLYHKLHPQKQIENAFSEKDLKTYQVMGLAMEDRMERALVELAREDGSQAQRPGELLSPEGIACSLDMVFVENGITRVGELKCPWKSCKGLVTDREGENEWPEKFSIYFSQIMGYCYVVGTRFGRIIIYFVNGDWKPPKPQLLGWDLEFSDQEINENWDALITCANEEVIDAARTRR